MFAGGLGKKRPLVPWSATVGGEAQEDRGARTPAAMCKGAREGPGELEAPSLHSEAEPGLLLQKQGGEGQGRAKE